MTIDEAIQLAYQHHVSGRLAEAEHIYRQILEQHPKHAESLRLLGTLAGQMGHWDAALDLTRQSVESNQDDAETHYQMGVALQGLGRLYEAIVAYRHALLIKPDFAEAYNNLANALTNTGQLDEAISAFRAAVRIKPNLADTHYNFGLALHDLGRIDEAIGAYRQAVHLNPDHAVAHGAILFALNCRAPFDPRELLIESRNWNRQHAAPLKRFIRPHSNDLNPDRRLRIGYVSPDFCDHAVSRFLSPLLGAHDHAAFELFAYAQVPAPDNVTAKLKTRCDEWRNTVGISDERVAEMVREDRIDILVDLAGHTAGNRLLVFARKPAPIQVTWLGYPGTTGLGAMDYRFTDALADPPENSGEFCCEQLIRLPQCNWCFQPPDDAPPVNELPAIAKQQVTFGSFNSVAKVSDPLLKLWAEILRATPGAKLLLKARGLRAESVQRHVRQVMADADVEPDRIELLGWVAAGAHLAQYHRVDIALDTYPYHGTTTTCEAFWMGVPVVSLAGETHVSRVGVSLLSNLGLPEWIAQTPERYVQIAADRAGDLPRLADMRRTLRGRMQTTPLMDGPRFTRDIEAAYRRMWRDWCKKNS